MIETNQKTIESETPSSPIDYFSNTYCNCFHLINEHVNEKCYGMDNNGGVWKACYCNKVTPIEFEIKEKEDATI